MSHRAFSFTVGPHQIKLSLEEVVPGQLLVEVLNPWSNREFANTVSVDEFLADIQKLLPDTIADPVEDTLMPCFAQTISDHLSQFGRITDADFCLYMAYYHMVREPLAKLTGGIEFDKALTMYNVEMFCHLMEKQGLRLTRTKFSAI